MKQIILPLFLSLCIGNILLAQDDALPGNAEMKAWMEFMTPGEMHKNLSIGEGEWKTKLTMWLAPGSEPILAEGTASGQMILDGRYLKMDHFAEVMNMPMHGISIEGYDNAQEKFVSIWIDNMGTGFSYAEGSYNSNTRIYNYEGKMTDPITKSDIWFRQETQIKDKNNILISMYQKAGDVEYKSMIVEFLK